MSRQSEPDLRSVRILSELTERPREEFEPPEDIDPASLDTVRVADGEKREPYGPGDELEL